MDDLVGVADAAAGDHAHGSSLHPGFDVAGSDGARVPVFIPIDDEDGARVQGAHERFRRQLAIPAADVLIQHLILALVGRHITASDGDAANLVREVIRVAPKGLDIGAHQPDARQADRVHAIGNVRHAEAFVKLQNPFVVGLRVLLVGLVKLYGFLVVVLRRTAVRGALGQQRGRGEHDSSSNGMMHVCWHQGSPDMLA
jgi:hypothetical protein